LQAGSVRGSRTGSRHAAAETESLDEAKAGAKKPKIAALIPASTGDGTILFSQLDL
jgi:hypothetical protein